MEWRRRADIVAINGELFVHLVNLALNVNKVFDQHDVFRGFVGYTGASRGGPRSLMVALKYPPEF